LVQLVVGAKEVLGDSSVVAYLQGSFAVGDADAHSDVDFIVVTKDDVTPKQQAELQALHQRLYALPISFAHDPWTKVHEPADPALLRSARQFIDYATRWAAEH
jgi:predicted nucleotidyltransferase